MEAKEIMNVRSVCAVDPRIDGRWHELSCGDQGSLFTSARWIEAVCSTYRLTPEARLTIDENGRAIGGFSWVTLRDLRGDRIMSLPFSDRAEPFVDDDATWRLLSDDAFAKGLSFGLRCFENSVAAADPRLEIAESAAWHATALDPCLDVLAARVKSSARRNVAAAKRAGVTVTVEYDLAAVQAYHRLHVRLRKYKYGLLAQPLELFERIWKAFAVDDSIITVLAHVNGEPVAGAMYLVWKDVLYYKFGASLREFLPLRPNDAIHWEAMTWGAARGLAALDWGLSDLDQPGLVAYKRKWATIERRIVTLQRRDTKPDPRTEEAAELFGEIVRLLSDHTVPDEITARAGRLLYRYFG